MTKSGNRFLFLNHATTLERDNKKWEPVFVPKSRDNKNLERTFGSIKCHPALNHALYRVVAVKAPIQI